MDLPSQLVHEARQERLILFLGAGVPLSATNDRGDPPPSARHLTKLLSDRFLAGRHSGESLAYVSDLAVSATDLGTVQSFVRDRFVGLKPAASHALMPRFKWRAIATTNYDLLVEDTYAADPKAVQTIVPFLSDVDRVDDKLRGERSVPYLKLHGCITRTLDESLPLILTTDQYVTHRENRTRLFDMLRSLAHEYPLVFVGHSMHDSDLRQVLLDLSKLRGLRPHYYLVRPDVDADEVRFWAQRKVTVVDGTFDQFMFALSSAIPEHQRTLLTLVPHDHPIQRRFAVNEPLSAALVEFLANDVEYIHPSLPSADGTPRAFYRGFDLGWYPIQQNLDVRRELTDVLLNEVMLRKDVDRSTPADLYLLRAEAGAGKTVFLRRLAWEAGNEADVLTLVLRETGQLEFDSLEELHRLVQQRIFLMVDNAADHVALLEHIMTQARAVALPLTVVATERINEWNMGGDRVAPFVTAPYQVPYLSRDESEELLRLLAEHGSLGHLSDKTPEQRLQAVEERAGRQLLVVLHEATSGRPFEEIIFDEFNEIRPKLAQDIYLSVCVLNRLNIPVRAGIISRMYDVPFSDFRLRFFAPLEHVVQVTEHPSSRDYLYTARHAGIATIVFERVLNSQMDRFNQYVALLAAMNISYSTDREAYRALLKGRVIVDMFHDHGAALEIFSVAQKVAPKDPYYFHQRGLYEMHRPNGNLDEALRYFKQARALNSRDSSVLHSMAELERKRAEGATTAYERERLRKDATRIAADLMSDERSRPSARHTLVQVAISRLQDALQAPTPSDREIDLAVQEIEKHLERGLQENPADSYLLTAEAKYAGVIADEERAFRALENAFRANRRNPFVTTRLSKAFKARGDRASAITTLESALDANPGDMQTHYRLALELREDANKSGDELRYHFRRAFTRGDRNYDAQFWYARYAFESRDQDERRDGDAIFARLRTVPLPMRYEERTKIRDLQATADNQPLVVSGAVARKESTFGFITADGAGERIFFHRRELTAVAWDSIRAGARVSFQIGFTFNGPVACEVKTLA